jgi:Uncharacterized Fe-S protein
MSYKLIPICRKCSLISILLLFFQAYLIQLIKKKVFLLLMLPKEKYSYFIKQTARSIGFDYCGIARAEKLDEDAYRLESWLHKGFQGKMDYMNNYFDLRIDPQN